MQENQSATAALYRELPYPGDGVVRTTVARIARRGLRKLAPHFLQKPKLRLLDVGCGTGEVTAGLAKLFPQAEITGIDVNPASLELAERLSRASRLSIRFVQCDLMHDPAAALRAAGVWSDERPFDLLFATGVLHHLPTPAAGFRHLRPLTASDGWFLAFMYSAFGRWNDAAARQLLDAAYPKDAFAQRAAAVASLRLSPRHGLREFVGGLRTRLRYGPPLSPWELLQVRLKRRALTHVSDTFSNPCETYYRFAELERLADETGWNVVGLAEGGGLPTSIADYTNDAAKRSLLERFAPADLYDYFAYLFRAFGFHYWLRPASGSRPSF